jgi:hypothetical protein
MRRKLMGAPVGHPFFGNQYTDGGYLPGSFKVVKEVLNEVVDKAISNSVTLTAKNSDKSILKTVSRQRPKNLVIKKIDAKGLNKNVYIAVGVGFVLTIGGYFAYNYLRKKNNLKKVEQQSIELNNVGVCIHCGEPLNESTYYSENEANGTEAYIVCKICGGQNFAWYADEPNKSDLE